MNHEANEIEVSGRRDLIEDLAHTYGMQRGSFWKTIMATVIPDNNNKQKPSNEQCIAFLAVAREHNLNPLTREIYAFPTKAGGIQPIVSVDGWAKLINSHSAFDGMDFEDHLNTDDELIAVTCRMHRKDRSHPISATEYMKECKRNTDPWKQWPARMLRHKAMIQCARYAFSFAGIIDPDEADRYHEVDVIDVPSEERQGRGNRLANIAAARRNTEEQSEFDDLPEYESEDQNEAEVDSRAEPEPDPEASQAPADHELDPEDIPE